VWFLLWFLVWFLFFKYPEGAEVARHTMCNQMAATCDEGVPHVHAMAHDDASGSSGLLALGLNASNNLKPFAFTIDTVCSALSAGGLTIP